MSLLKTDPHYKIVILGIWIFFCQQFAGVNAINFYSSQMFKTIGTGDSENILTGLLGLCNLVFLFISLSLVNLVARKKLFIFGCFAIAGVLMICGAFSFTIYNVVPVVMIFVYMFFFNITLSPLAWTIIAEMVHSKLINMCVASHWINALIIA